MFVCRTFHAQDKVPKALVTFGLAIGDAVTAWGLHKGTIEAFREPVGFLGYTGEALVSWGGKRTEWVSCNDLAKA